MGIGGGELAAGVDISILSMFSPALLPCAVSLSLGFCSLLSCIGTSCAEPLAPFSIDKLLVPFHEGSSHVWPVKLFSWKPLFCHRRQGAPDRSSALKLALIKPVFALGPSL